MRLGGTWKEAALKERALAIEMHETFSPVDEQQPSLFLIAETRC